jgi:hypothetical protein
MLGRKPATGIEAGSRGGAVEQSHGPHAILDGDYSVLDMHTNPTELLTAAKQKLEQTAANWDVSAEVLHQTKQTSGEERRASRAGLVKSRLAQQKLHRPADRNLMRLTALVWNTFSSNRFSTVDPKLLDPRIDYSEPREIESPAEKRSTLKAGMELGTDSPVDFVMAQDPDIKTRAEAMKKIKRNLDETNEVLQARKEFSQPAAIAAAQGAIGGAISGVTRAPEGAPQPDPGAPGSTE